MVDAATYKAKAAATVPFSPPDLRLATRSSPTPPPPALWFADRHLSIIWESPTSQRIDLDLSLPGHASRRSSPVSFQPPLRLLCHGFTRAESAAGTVWVRGLPRLSRPSRRRRCHPGNDRCGARAGDLGLYSGANHLGPFLSNGNNQSACLPFDVIQQARGRWVSCTSDHHVYARASGEHTDFRGVLCLPGRIGWRGQPGKLRHQFRLRLPF